MNIFQRDGHEIIKSDFNELYQDLVGWMCDKKLHNNSLELLTILTNHNILTNNSNYKILEIGAAGCRNLKYIHDEYPDIQYFANDLHKDASFKNMHKSMRDVIRFYEGKTQDVIKNFSSNSIDLLIDSDHLVHVNYTDTNKILNYINNTIKPKHFLIRSVLKNNPKRKPCPYHKHDYNKQLTNYKEIFYKVSDQHTNWYIKLFKLKT